MTLTGELRPEESFGAGAVLSQRLFGWRRFAFFIYLAVMVFQVVVWIGATPASASPLVSIMGMSVTAVILAYGYKRWCSGLGASAWSRMGVTPSEHRYRVDDVGLEISCEDGVATTLPWAAVIELHRGKTLWLFITRNGGSTYIPRRLFAAVADEKAFLTLCLDRLSPDARSRSVGATAFIAGEQA